MTSKKERKPQSDGAFVFSTERQVIPVTIDDKKYELKEADGDAAAIWRNSMISTARLGPNGKAQSMGNVADSEPLLVSLCLYPEGEDTHLEVSTVRGWPSRIVKALHKKVMEISDLEEDEEAEEEAKKEQESTQDG